MDYPRIVSTQNPRIKQARNLRDRRYRRETGLVSVEGYAELSLGLSAGLVPRTLFLCPERLKPGEAGLLDIVLASGSESLGRRGGSPRNGEASRAPEIYLIPGGLMDKISYREHPDAWFCVAQAMDSGLEVLERRMEAKRREGENPLLVVAEDLEKPGNLGAIFRTAEAAGAQGIICVDGRTDLGNPNVIRASKGTVFALPAVESRAAEACDWLRGRGIQIIAADPAGTRDFWEIDMKPASAFVLGAENEGLSDFWRQEADILARIPMRGEVNSLNVATSAALLLYEAYRQRRGEVS